MTSELHDQDIYDEHNRDGEARYVSDIYGLKFPIAPQDDEPAPKTWLEVLSEANRHLKRIVVGPFRLVAEAFDGSCRLIKGVGRMPQAINDRIRMSHVKAERKEFLRQESIQEHQALVEIPAVESRLKEIINRLQSKGYAVAFRNAPSGEIIVVVVKPDCEEQAFQLGLKDLEDFKKLGGIEPVITETEAGDDDADQDLGEGDDIPSS